MGLRVLSLFDGMSCGQLALQRLGIEVSTYYASEIDKYAIEVCQANFPETIQVGDVCNLKTEDFQDIDLILAGSPCQGFSFAGKQLAFDDPRSALFFEFIRMLKGIKPKYFLLENVRMNQFKHRTHYKYRLRITTSHKSSLLIIIKYESLPSCSFSHLHSHSHFYSQFQCLNVPSMG